jgi:hypothetical protein
LIVVRLQLIGVVVEDNGSPRRAMFHRDHHGSHPRFETITVSAATVEPTSQAIAI